MRRNRAAEARRRRRLHNAIDFNIGVAGPIVRMINSLLHGQDRCETSISTLHQGRPFFACLGGEDGSETLSHHWPFRSVELSRKIAFAFESREPQQFSVKLRL